MLSLLNEFSYRKKMEFSFSEEAWISYHKTMKIEDNSYLSTYCFNLCVKKEGLPGAMNSFTCNIISQLLAKLLVHIPLGQMENISPPSLRQK